MTKSGRNNTIKVGLRNAALITGSIFTAITGATAKEHKPKTSANESQVIAHLSFNGQTAVDMAMEKEINNKIYLYVQHSRDEGISVIDITQPSKAKILGVVSWPNSAVASRMNITGRLGIITESVDAPNRDKTHPDLVLWDLSNPVSPRIVEHFSDVVRWFEDERDFIYVLNSEGLFVISKPAERQPEQLSSSDY